MLNSLFVSVVCIFFFPPIAHTEQKELLIGLIPEMSVFKQMKRFKPLSDYLSEKTGVKIKLTILSKYRGIINRFKTHGLDGAFFGSFTGAAAIE